MIKFVVAVLPAVFLVLPNGGSVDWVDRDVPCAHCGDYIDELMVFSHLAPEPWGGNREYWVNKGHGWHGDEERTGLCVGGGNHGFGGCEGSEESPMEILDRLLASAADDNDHSELSYILKLGNLASLNLHRQSVQVADCGGFILANIRVSPEVLEEVRGSQ